MPLLLPNSAPARSVAGPISLRLLPSLACLVVAVWGISVCRALVHSAVAGPYAGANHLVGVASWVVLFGPFAALGGYGLVRTWGRFRRGQAEQRAAEPVQIFPPAHSASVQAATFAAGTSQSARASVEPLDDDTRQRLDQLASRAARVIGIVVGLLFLLSGITGFVLGWIYTHRPVEMHSSIHYELANLRLVSLLLVGCGLSVLVGCFILRETFARPRTTWLVSLHAFAAIAKRRVSLNPRTGKAGK